MAVDNETLEELRKTLKTLLDQTMPEQLRHEMRDKLLQAISNDSGLGKAWKQVSGNTLRENLGQDTHQFQEMLTQSLPALEKPKSKPENYNSVMNRLDTQFSALSMRPPSPNPQNEKKDTMSTLVRKEMMDVMKKNPEIGAEFLSAKAVSQKDRQLSIALFKDFKKSLNEDKVAMSSMLIGLKANPMGATLLGGTGQDLGAPITDLQGGVVHKRATHGDHKIEEKSHEKQMGHKDGEKSHEKQSDHTPKGKPDLTKILKQVLQTVMHELDKGLQSESTHKPMTPFSTKPKPKE